MAKNRGLGLGLSELLSDVKAASSSSNHKHGLRNLAIDLLKPGKYQPRQDMDREALGELSRSISAQGIIQPIVVRPLEGNSYEIIAGERRWRAAQLAKLHEVPVVIREIPDNQVMVISLIENIQREDLNAIDAAVGIHRLIVEFKMTHESAASAIGKSRAAVTNLLRLLELAEEVKEMLKQKLLEMGHARALLALDKAKQHAIAKLISSKKMSVRAAENLIRQLLKQPGSTKKAHVDPNTIELQKQISTKLAAPVRIYHTKKGSGKIVVKYSNLDELDGIISHIR